MARPDEREWLLCGDLPCLRCGYNLRGLVGPAIRCPECGKINDLRHPQAWRRRDLPLGVRQREHWPATAVSLGLLAAITGPLLVILVKDGAPPPVAALIVGGAFTATAAGWLINCRRWIRSAVDTGWAVGVLVLVHVSAAAIPATPIAMMVTASATPLLLVVLGISGLLWAQRLIAGAERSRQFRMDWRDWQVPLARGDEPTEPPQR